ncbi:MAG: hypothetical protein AAGC92_17045, partial [Pseudomonadota bacterium]
MALSSLDEITQKNSALSAQSVSDAQSLSKIAVHLQGIIGFFSINVAVGSGTNPQTADAKPILPSRKDKRVA